MNRTPCGGNEGRMRLPIVYLPSAAACLVLVCSGGGGCGTTRGAPAGAEATAVDEADADASDDAASEDSSAGELLDVGGSGATGGEEGGSSTVCEHVDAIFAFDISGSMAGEISAMSDASTFAGFRDTLLDAGNGLADFQLAIMDDTPAFPYYHDNSGLPDELPCDFSSGKNYMTSTSPAFADEYACLFANAADGFTHVGDYAGAGATTPLGPGLEYLEMGTEMPARSAALSVSHATALQTNAGFLRDDAVLFVVTISDEDDGIFVDGALDKDPPMAEVVAQMTEAHDRLVTAKGGDPKKVVFLGIGAGSDGCVGPYGDTIREAKNLQVLVSLFEADGQGLFVDLCTDDLREGIAAALEIVDQSCDDFVPAG